MCPDCVNGFVFFVGYQDTVLELAVFGFEVSLLGVWAGFLISSFFFSTRVATKIVSLSPFGFNKNNSALMLSSSPLTKTAVRVCSSSQPTEAANISNWAR